MRKILLTGGCGFISQNIIQYLNSLGYDTWYLTRNPKIKRNSITIDITNRSDIELNLRLNQIDAIIHVAAHIPDPENKHDIDLCQKVNFDSTNILLKYCVDNNIKKFIYISSLSIFDENKDLFIDENTVPNPKTDYSISKLSAEYLCRFYYRNYGIEASILRLGTIYGSGMVKTRMIPFFIRQCLANKDFEIYKSNIQLNLAYISDVVKVVENLLYSPTSTYHFTTESITKKEMVERILLLTNSKSKIIFTNESIIDFKVFSINKIRMVLNQKNLNFHSINDGLNHYIKEF